MRVRRRGGGGGEGGCREHRGGKRREGPQGGEATQQLITLCLAHRQGGYSGDEIRTAPWPIR